MFKKILLNDAPHNFTEQDLPCLITYAHKTGGSQFSISLTAQLFESGSKILFFTAYPMARENFMEMENNKLEDISVVSDVDKLDNTKRVIILESGNEQLFLDVLTKLNDIQDRVVLVKNAEQFSAETLNKSLGLNKLIFSGDMDNLPSGVNFNISLFKTIIAFSKPDKLTINIPENLEKYTGFCTSKNGHNGTVTLGS